MGTPQSALHPHAPVGTCLLAQAPRCAALCLLQVVAQVELWRSRESGKYRTKVYVLPRQLDEQVRCVATIKTAFEVMSQSLCHEGVSLWVFDLLKTARSRGGKLVPPFVTPALQHVGGMSCRALYRACPHVRLPCPAGGPAAPAAARAGTGAAHTSAGCLHQRADTGAFQDRALPVLTRAGGYQLNLLGEGRSRSSAGRRAI